MISIKSAYLKQYDTSYGGYPFSIEVSIEVSKKYFHKVKKLNALGGLYNRDTSNALYQITKGQMPYAECVLVKEHRAKGESKTIDLRFLFRDQDAAQALGMPGKIYQDGVFRPEWGTYHSLLRGGAE